MSRKEMIQEGTKGQRDEGTKGETAKRQKVKKSKPQSPAPGPPALAAAEVRMVPLAQIRRAAYNPRQELKPGDPEFEKLAASMAKFGLVQPLVWNERNGNLVGGHQRLSVLLHSRHEGEARRHGGTEARRHEGRHEGTQGQRDEELLLPCCVVNLPLAEEKALNLALNKIEGAWDEQKLGTLLAELKALEDFDETVSGFSSEEIDQQIAALAADLSLEGTAPEPAAQEFLVTVACKDASQQRSLHRKLHNQGWNARCVTREVSP